jgi:hypothetical protein
MVVICAGWKCPACTLVNPPTRPGCAACTTERPLQYVVPVDYHANEQELQRMKQEQQVDNDLQQVCSLLILSILITFRMFLTLYKSTRVNLDVGFVINTKKDIKNSVFLK